MDRKETEMLKKDEGYLSKEGKTIKIVSNANTVTSDTQGKEFVNVPSIVVEKNNIQRMNSSKDLFNS